MLTTRRIFPTLRAALLPLLFLVASAHFAVAETSTTTTGSPGEVIAGLQTDLLDLMKRSDELGYQGRFDTIGDVVDSAFDLAFMAEKSVGRHWRKLSEKEQQRWITSFRNMTCATYADRFDGYSGQSFESLGEEEASHGTVVVRTRIILPDEDDVELNYRLRETAAGWRIIDVYLNGTVSELALRRAEYSAVLKREGFDKLIATVEDKTAQYAAGEIN